MRAPQLDGRLSAAMEMVRQGSRAADVGTDHGRLALRLVLEEKCPLVYASDLRREPLEKARRLVARFGFEDRVICRLTDGLEGFLPQEVDDVILAGMGGETIAQIIQRAPWLQDGSKQLVLVPTTSPDLLRAFLARQGFSVIQERAVEAKGRFYGVLCTRYSGHSRQLSPLEAIVGNIQRSGPAAHGYFQKALYIEEKALKGKQGAQREEHLRLIAALKEVVEECTQ